MIDEYTKLEGMQGWARDIMASRDPDFVIGPEANPYLRRWWIVPRNEGCNVYLHEILRSDDDRAGHDHPWANRSYLIEGGYEEAVYYRHSPWLEMGRFERKAGDYLFREAEDTHRLIVPEGGALRQPVHDRTEGARLGLLVPRRRSRRASLRAVAALSRRRCQGSHRQGVR